MSMTEIERRKLAYKTGLRVRATEDISHKFREAVTHAGTYGSVFFVTEVGDIIVEFDDGAAAAITDRKQIRTVHDPEYSPKCDGNGKRLTAGDYVAWYGTEDMNESDVGRIVSVSDPDGDMDDFGRMYGINPKVYVDFGDGEEEFGTIDRRKWYTDDTLYEAEDLELVEPHRR